MVITPVLRLQTVFCIFHLLYKFVLAFEVVDLRFLSAVNSHKLSKHDYHVIEMTLPSTKVSYVMHLSKSTTLFAADNIGYSHTSMEHYDDCLYSGPVTSQGIESGMASLSSCLHERAFEGLVRIGNDHFQLSPSIHHLEKRNVSMKAFASSDTNVKHKLTKPKVSAFTAKRTRTDDKTVAAEDLVKAREQMMKDQELLEDETDEDETDQLDSVDNSLFKDDSNENSVDFETLVTTRWKTKSKRKPKKRIAKVIELALFTDESFFKSWKAQYPEDTEKKINQYLLALVNNMNYLYQQPSLKPKISFRLVHVGIQKFTPAGLSPSTTAERYLDSFCKFAGKKDTKGAAWDHAMMISGLQLLDEIGNDNLGIAFTSTMCLRYYSCSLVEYNKGFETAFTAAHELGHSLGMEHDGDLMNKKCDESKFIMAALAGSGQVNWSPCSSKNAENFLASGDPRARVKDPSSLPRCLTKRGSKKPGIRYRTGQFPGRIFNIKKQCQQVCDQCTPYVKKEAPYNSICESLYCQSSTDGIIPVHPALEGTACSANGQKMCRNGKCR